MKSYKHSLQNQPQASFRFISDQILIGFLNSTLHQIGIRNISNWSFPIFWILYLSNIFLSRVVSFVLFKWPLITFASWKVRASRERFWEYPQMSMIKRLFLYTSSFIPIPLSLLSLYPYPFILIPLSLLSHYPYPFIPIPLSLSLYPYHFIPIP